MMQESVEGTLERVVSARSRAPLCRQRRGARPGRLAAARSARRRRHRDPRGIWRPGPRHSRGRAGRRDARPHVAPVPFIGVRRHGAAGADEGRHGRQRDHWLPKLASGKTTIAVALSEFGGSAREGAGITASNGKLSGKALFAIDFARRGVFIVADRNGRLYLVDAEAPGLSTRRSRPSTHARVRRTDVAPCRGRAAAR